MTAVAEPLAGVASPPSPPSSPTAIGEGGLGPQGEAERVCRRVRALAAARTVTEYVRAERELVEAAVALHAAMYPERPPLVFVRGPLAS